MSDKVSHSSSDEQENVSQTDVSEFSQEEGLEQEADSNTEDLELNNENSPDLKQKLEETENLLKRQMADFHNFRRRAQEEKDSLKDFVLNNVLLDFLPIFDNIERALNSAKSENATLESIVQGLEGVMSLYSSLLEKHQIEKIDSVGKEFDASLHEALFTQEGDYTVKTVIQEVEQAYTRDNKVIRTAKVAVGVPKASNEAEQNE